MHALNALLTETGPMTTMCVRFTACVHKQALQKEVNFAKKSQAHVENVINSIRKAS